MTRRGQPFEPREELIRRVYAFVAYRIGDGARAEDVTSAVLERAVRYRHSYDPDRGQPLTWLLGIARRVLADERAPATAPLDIDVISLAEPTDVAEGSARRLTVRRAVRRLPDRDRELVALRYGADLTAREIGELLGMGTNAVEVALHRALARLRAELAPDFDVRVEALGR